MSTILQQTNELRNPLLLIGGNRAQALDFAKRILGPMHHAKMDAGNHPDLYFFMPEEKSGLHLMNTIQKLIQEMALHPFEAVSKVCIIEDAEKMLPPTSNALLKTLEEPNLSTFFILLTHHPKRLLPTIYSRLHPIIFPAAQADSYDLSAYFDLAQKGMWDELFEKLPDLEEKESEVLFRACLYWAAQQKNPTLYKKMSELIVQGQKALDHHLKFRNIFLNFLVQIYSY